MRARWIVSGLLLLLLGGGAWATFTKVMSSELYLFPGGIEIPATGVLTAGEVDTGLLKINGTGIQINAGNITATTSDVTIDDLTADVCTLGATFATNIALGDRVPSPPAPTTFVHAVGPTDVALHVEDSASRPLLRVLSTNGQCILGEASGARDTMLVLYPGISQSSNPLLRVYDQQAAIRTELSADGSLTMTTRKPSQTSGNGTDGTDILTITGGDGGNTTGVTGQTAGRGADINVTAGNGGNAPSGSFNGSGGTISFTAGGAGGGAGNPGSPGAINLQTISGEINLDGRTIITPQIVTITADNQLVTPPRGVLLLDSNDTTNTNRTFTLDDGDLGQILYLTVTHATHEVELQSGGNVALVGGTAWPPATNQLNDTLVLLWNGNAWVELSRSAP